jgi:hypothetical protein
MGKFAGFWKRIKNIGINALNSTINGLSKINNLYKKYKPIVSTGIEALMCVVPGGALAAPIVNLGLNKISNLVDLAKFGIDNPNTFLPSSAPKHINNGPIHVGKISHQDKINSRFDDLRRINTSTSN